MPKKASAQQTWLEHWLGLLHFGMGISCTLAQYISTMSTLQVIRRSALDLAAYSQFILTSAELMPYVHAFHLDAVCSGHWAVLMPQGETIATTPWLAPLPYRSAFKPLRWIMQPLFSQQLGVLFRQDLETSAQVAVLKQVLGYLLHQTLPVVYALNHANTKLLEQEQPEWWTKLKAVPGLVELAPNYVVPLHQTYEQIEAGYAHNLVKKLRRRHPHEYVYDDDPKHEVYALFRDHINAEKHILAPRHLNKLEWVIKVWREHGLLWSGRSYDPDGNLLAGLLYMKTQATDGLRYTTFMGGATALGKKRDSQMKLMARHHQDWCGQPGLYDFEGSRIPGIAQVFKTYGPTLEQYAVLRKGWGSIKSL